MNGKRLQAVASIVGLCLAAGGCMVTSSKYEMKTKEADALRDAVAAANKEKNVLEARNEALRKQLADEKDAAEALDARVKTLTADNRRIGEDLEAAQKNYEGTRITREQFIAELLEKEKVTGKRTQALSARAQACELALETLRKDVAARDAETAELRDELEKTGDAETLKRERDILLGRVERLMEEHRHEEKRRDDRFASLAETIAKTSRRSSVTPLGPALRVVLPENVLFAKGKTTLSEEGRKVVSEVGKAAAELPGASILLSAGGKKLAGEIRDVLAKPGKVPKERILTDVHANAKGAALLLVVP